MLNSKALTKLQAAFVVAIIVVGAVGGGVAYVLLGDLNQSEGKIKIGVFADLDNIMGKQAWQGAVLAAEQINAEGGILGRQVEVIGEDHDVESGLDLVKVSLTLTRLLTYHKVDFVIGQIDGDAGLICQDIMAEHKKIMLGVLGSVNELTQRVLDNYDRYKYYFRVWSFNTTSMFEGMTESLVLLREQTGFNKVGYLAEDLTYAKQITERLDHVLPEVYGFEVVYKGTFPSGVSDYSSYLATAEAAGTEVLLPLIWINNGIPLIKEWYGRQSPILIYGGISNRIGLLESWEWTEGKCEHVVTSGLPIMAGYPLTSKTLPVRDAYINRWNSTPQAGAAAYDALRFILATAIQRAGTIETEKVIEALEETNIETSMARNFVFTSSHDVMVGENPNDPEEDYLLMMLWQWQNGKMVPVYPKKIMDEAGSTYTFPDWPGPWSK